MDLSYIIILALSFQSSLEYSMLLPTAYTYVDNLGGSSLFLGLVRQHRSINAVAEGEDARHRRAEMLVHDDAPHLRAAASRTRDH